MIAALYSLPTTIESNRMCICNQVKRAEVRMRGRGRHAIHSIARCDGGRAHCIHVTRARSALPPAHPLYYWHLANALSAYFMNTALRLIALHCLHFTPILEGLGDRFGHHLSVDCAHSLRINERNQFTNTKFTGPNTQTAKHTSR